MTDALWDGAFNLSDLGGLPTDRGRTSAGIIFRSGRPEALTKQGWRDARRAGLMTIVDLRNDRERSRLDYDPIIDEDAMKSITVVRAPTEDPDDPDFMCVCGPWLDHPRSYADNLRFFPSKFLVIFEAISDARGTVLIHCSGGRDRTGMVVAMLLALAGVSAEVIADNYELAFREANAQLALRPEISSESVYSESVYSEDDLTIRVEERRAAMIHWIGSFNVGGYLREIGLSRADLVRLTDLLHHASTGQRDPLG